MTATISRNSGRLAVPLTQNTAPVFEFNCLYSHDIRRKQKRWQDGFLKYHTFNKRVMVYDVPRNLVGDMHWLGEEEIQEGDELKLEKGGALVQVADKIGQTETDLTDLRKSRSRETGNSDGRSPARPNSRRSGLARPSGGKSSFPLTNKSLNAVLGTPRGPIGKAQLPSVSPYEQRYSQVENETWTGGRPTKRQRTVHTPKELAKRDDQVAEPLLAERTQSRNQNARLLQLGGKKTLASNSPQRAHSSTIVDLSSDTEQDERCVQEASSDAMQLPSSPVKALTDAFRRPPGSPSFQPQRADPSQRSVIQPAGTRTDLGPRQLKNQLGSHEEDGEYLVSEKRNVKSKARPEAVANAGGREIGTQMECSSPRRVKVSSRAGKTLRMKTSAPKRKKLLCQEPPKPIERAESTAYRIDKHDDEYSVGDEGENDSDTRGYVDSLTQRPSIIDKENESTSRHRFDAQKPVSTNQEYDIGSNIEEDDLADLSNFAATAIEEDHFQPHDPNPVISSSPARTSHHEDDPGVSPLQAEAETPQTQPSTRLAETSADHDTTDTRPTCPSAQASVETAPENTKQNARHPELRHPSPELDPPEAVSDPDKNSTKMDKAEPASGRRVNTAASKPFRAPKVALKPKGAEPQPCSGPWSREAFDLFTWRPPNWDEEMWCVKGS